MQGSEDKIFTYTVITTSPNKQLTFLHDRMPVILENGSEDITTWLDPNRTSWSKELQSLLKPFKGELEVYPVSKDVGKVGNNSESFIIPLASSKNKSNIANFFAKGAAKGESKSAIGSNSVSLTKSASDVKEEEEYSTLIKSETEEWSTDFGEKDSASMLSPVSKHDAQRGIKHKLDNAETAEEPPAKLSKMSESPNKAVSPQKTKMRSATSNSTTSPKKNINREKGSQKITNFFSK